MKDLIIIGAGGFGRELFFLAKESYGYEKEFKILGFIDDNIYALNNYNGYPNILGKISDFEFTPNNVFICSIADISIKNDIIEKFTKSGAEFFTLIHRTARVTDTARIGKGCIIGPMASIGADTIIGDFTIIQTGSIVGHDVEVGRNSRLDNYAILVAESKIGSNCIVHSNSVINYGVKISDNSTVGACSFVVRNVKSNVSVFGNPAKQLV